MESVLRIWFLKIYAVISVRKHTCHLILHLDIYL